VSVAQDKSAAAIKKSEKDKQALSDKYNQAQLNVIAMYEEVRRALTNNRSE